MRIPRPCLAAGCPSLATQRGYCNRHATPRETFYDSAQWRKDRATFLKAHPWCRCGEKATIVDHVVPRSRGGADHPSNFQALCARDHGRKSVKYDGALSHA